jgi:uncharacterized protein (TIGR02145 family)
MKILLRISHVILLVMASLLIMACKKNEPAKLPVITTTPATYITTIAATSGGNIISNGGAEILTKGVCWGVTINPSTSDIKTEDRVGAAQFVIRLSGLTSGTDYHIRAYATNSVGTAYGADMPFSTLGQSPSSITLPATKISLTGAKLNGTVNANELSAKVTFEYGLTKSYGSTVTAAQSPVTGNTITIVSADITGLTSGSIYHFRIKSVNSIGTTYGDDTTFSTFHVATSLPVLSTTSVLGITGTTAISGGNITEDGGGDIIEKGVCWSLNAYPDINVSHTSNGSGIENFTSKLTGLSVYVTYYVRAYATNSFGTAYGNQNIFSTIFVDLDGNLYNAVTIGTQVWMKENLKTTVLNDGLSIRLVTDNKPWSELYYAGYCWYANDSSTYKHRYGALYNWYAVHTGKLCPTGWHVSTDSDWKTLEMFLGMTQNEADAQGWRGTDQGTQLKSKTGWAVRDDIGSDIVGFSALPGGYRNSDGGYYGSGQIGLWWLPEVLSASTAWYRFVVNYNSGPGLNTIYRAGNQNKVDGQSVRCVK